MPEWSSADVCIINTCTVTAEADKDALRLLRRIARRNPAARLIVTGCLASRDPRVIREAAPAAEIVGNAGKDSIPAMLGCAAAPAGVTGLEGRSRAFLKIQDGCNMSCTYCIIPRLRPELSRKPLASVLAEVRGLVDRGHAEIVLCGVRLGRWLDEDAAGRRVDLSGLVARLLEIPGEFRVRLSSLEITDAVDRLFDLARDSGGRLCPSFHLPLQSGCDAVLRRMQRWYATAFFARRAAALRERLPDAGLYTDVMAGFPGETEGEFAESFEFAKKLGFSGLHVFRYSRRSGTPAARARQVPEAVVVSRAEAFRELDRELRTRAAARAVGCERVAVATQDSRREALCEDFLTVTLPETLGPGLRRVKVTAAEGGRARAVPLVPVVV